MSIPPKNVYRPICVSFIFNDLIYHKTNLFGVNFKNNGQNLSQVSSKPSDLESAIFEDSNDISICKF